MSMNSSRFRHALLGASAMVSAAAVASASYAADARQFDFDMPAQPLTLALKTFGATADQQLIFSESLVKDRTAPALKGSYTPDQALAMLLGGTGLIADKTPGGVVTIRSASDPQSGSAADGADGTVAALVVTAQKREENIQDVPIAMSAFTQEDLTKSQVAGGPDLMTQVPNFTFTKTNFSGYSIQIRGIGTQAISATTDPAVAVAFNNTPFIRNRFFEQEFYDLERVEVLRGPQGTLYGRNATAGVVNVISAKPKHEFEAKLSADVGNYNSTRLEGMLNLPLVADKAALRIAGAWTKRDGYVKNILTGQQTDGRNLWSGRVTLALNPTDRLSADLIYEHFQENDDRLRSGKQLCRKDLGPSEINGIPVPQFSDALTDFAANYFSQGCLPASLYSPDSFQTPNGYALPYYGPLKGVGGPVDPYLDPYRNSVQSTNLREIETHITPDYEASNDTVELQIKFDLTPALTLNSETGYNRDHLFSFEDYNRFDTTRGVFTPGRDRNRFDIIDENGVFCDPQLGCTDRLAAGDLSTAESRQFSQEFRLESNFEGPLNFSVGANFLRYETEDKYYVFINSLTAFEAGGAGFENPAPWPSSNYFCFADPAAYQAGSDKGFIWSNPNVTRSVDGCHYIDLGDIHHLDDQGRNYFLSKNPYRLLSYAAFGELYWQATDTLRVTAGLRWTDDRKVAPQIPSWLLAALTYGTPTRKTIRQEWQEPTGRLAVDWKPDLSFTDETLVYGSYVHGYKAGGANPPPTVVIGAGVNLDFDAVTNSFLTHPQTFAPEFVNAYELGTKNTLLDGRLTFNVNAFYYDYTGYQISEIVDRSAVNLNFDAKIWGSELEVDWRPIENLRLGFKGGYENTRVADGSEAIDLMDRTAGDPGFIVKRPFPTIPSNCIVPVAVADSRTCFSYYTQIYTDTPNNGEGIAKDVSGNQLPNAPKFTATLIGDYTLPLPNDWLVTLHTDLYYQSEAWTRIFNDPGYDKLKAYNNVNVAAIFSNEDRGWQVMAYVKNLFNRDNITGAFLNSDDTGLTTNVFLNEPRLFGLRVTKNWNGSAWWSAHANASGWYPYRVEVDGAYGRTSGGKEPLIPPTAALFPAEHPYPLGVQNDLDWGSAGGVKFTYQPSADAWSIGAGIRYGRAKGSAEVHTQWNAPGGYTFGPASIEYLANLTGRPVEEWQAQLGGKYYNPATNYIYNYATTTGSSEESFAIADFAVGKDVGLGRLAKSHIDGGLRYAKFRSGGAVVMFGRPDLTVAPVDVVKYGVTMDRFQAAANFAREFEGAGPAANWDIAIPLLGEPTSSGSFDLDVGLGGSVLWGKQTAKVKGSVDGSTEITVRSFLAGGATAETYTTPIDVRRSKQVAVPGLNANLGLSYTLGGLKVSGGYRVERYFNAIDGGIAERKTYDRQFDGPYFKVSVGFGG